MLQDMDIPSTNVLVNALMTLLARSLRPNDVLSCSTETIREPESFFLISRSVVGCQEKNNKVKHNHNIIQCGQWVGEKSASQGWLEKGWLGEDFLPKGTIF